MRLKTPRMTPWPELRIADWRDTYATLQLYAQIVGKIRLALTPKMNQWWNVPLYVTPRGLTTSRCPTGSARSPSTSISSTIGCSSRTATVTCASCRSPRPVCAFHDELFAELAAIGRPGPHRQGSPGVPGDHAFR